MLGSSNDIETGGLGEPAHHYRGEDPDNGLEVLSGAQCQHIRAIPIERLAAPTGNVGPQVLNQMREILADMLDL